MTADILWRIQLLGGVGATGPGANGAAVSRFRTQRARSLFAYLAYHLGRAAPREALCELLWPETEPETGRNRLRQALTSLRHQLEPPGVAAGAVIVADRASVRLNAGACATDLGDFERTLAEAARAADARARAEALARAVALGAGELCPGEYHDWALSERERVRGLWFRAGHDLCAALERAGDRGRALEHARRLAAADPLREEARRDYMRLLAAAGEPAAALAEFRDLERALSRSIGIAAATATRDLAREIERRARSTGPAAGAEDASSLALSSRDPQRAEAKPDPEPVATGAALGAVVLASGDGILDGDARPRIHALPAEALAAARLLRERSPGARIAVLVAEVLPGRALADPERAARFLATAAPGEILCCAATAALLRDRVEGAPPPAPRAPGRAAREGRLPPRLTRFFGRTDDLDRVAAALERDGARLVTITGPAGIGKTRLAVEAAAVARERLGAAAWFVPLAGIDEPAAIGAAIRDALGIDPAPGVPPLDQVARVIADERALLVLDNLEHLLRDRSATPAIVAALLDRLPAAAVVVTSRRRIGLEGEHELPLGPLAAPAIDSLERLAAVPSVAIFVDRARAVRPDFQLTARNAAALAELCARLEGIPLALELAAGRAQALTPAQMLAGLDARFELLVRRGRDASAPHRSLRVAIDASVGALAPPLRDFFVRLSVFRGGFDVEAALAVAEPDAAVVPSEALAEFLACSLIARAGDEGRFHLLETLREHAAEQLDAATAAALAGRHAAYFGDLVERAAAALYGPGQAVALERLAREHDNVRAALAWALRHDPERALRIAGGATSFWMLRGHVVEGRAALAEALARSTAPSAARAAALRGAASLAWQTTDYDATQALAAEALATARRAGRDASGDEIGALRILGYIARERGDPGGARRLTEEALELARARGDRAAAAQALGDLSTLDRLAADLERAAARAAEGVAIQREIGHRRGLAIALLNLGTLARQRGDAAAGLAHFEESIAISRELREEHGIAQGLVNLSQARRALGDAEGARRAAEEGAAIHRRLGTIQGLGYALVIAADALRDQGALADARRASEEALGIFRRSGQRRGVASATAELGMIAGREGDLAGGRARIVEGIAGLRDVGNAVGTIEPLQELAAIALAAGDPERAARLAGAVAAARASTGLAPTPGEARVFDRVTAGARAALGAARFDAAHAEGRAGSWLEAT